MLPALSVARTATFGGPGVDGVQSNSQRRHASGPGPGISRAGDHVRCPSVLTSTRVISPHPDQAKPNTVVVPAETVCPSAGEAMTDFTGISRTGPETFPSRSAMM